MEGGAIGPHARPAQCGSKRSREEEEGGDKRRVVGGDDLDLRRSSSLFDDVLEVPALDDDMWAPGGAMLPPPGLPTPVAGAGVAVFDFE
jgi:hypothetical protein